MSSQYTFTGQYSFNIDSKNRINIPAPLRKQFSNKDKKTFVVTRGIDSCAWIYPITEWKKIQSELQQLSSLSKTNRIFLRNHLRHANILKYDSQGRFVLPQSLIEYASIKKDITIIGVLNKIEIWNTKLLNEIDKSDNINDQSYDQLSERVNI
ncbi:MAG: division/cell wall cluster transcriptional repressor MraZ [Candidatus Neomarinimicrobiota bacterium]|jgi:MraZ protein|tara:strand:- start:165 stop:623 length:459 start_codon:yes stop_codon:yes gene_type:complete